MADDETLGPPQIAGLSYQGLLGAGGFADVYRYEQTALGRDVAVKVIHGLGDAARAQFRAEASVMARLSSHPFVVPIYQVGESDDGRPYLVMQLCAKPTLAARLREQTLPVEDVVRFGVQLAGAVESAHRMGILHRDIKPANILFNEYGHPLLADFGIAQSTDHAQPLRAFTPSYAPPEQAAGMPSTAAVDVFGLCATLWAALTGEPPAGPVVAGATLAGLGRDDVPPALEDALLGGLSRDPADRHPTALALGRALQRVQSRLGMNVTAIELWDGSGHSPDTVEVPPPPSDSRTHLVTLEDAPTLAAEGESASAATALAPAAAPQQPPFATPQQAPWPSPQQASGPAWQPPGAAQVQQPVAAPPGHGATPLGARPPMAEEGRHSSLPGMLVALGALLVLAFALFGLWRTLPGLVGGGDPTPTSTTSTSPATTSTSSATSTSTSSARPSTDRSVSVPAPVTTSAGADSTSTDLSQVGGSSWGQ